MKQYTGKKKNCFIQDCQPGTKQKSPPAGVGCHDGGANLLAAGVACQRVVIGISWGGGGFLKLFIFGGPPSGKKIALLVSTIERHRKLLHFIEHL